MNSISSLFGKPRGVHWWISIAFICFGLLMLVALTIQSFNSQRLLENRFWIDALHSLSRDHAQRVRRGEVASLPHSGIVRSWYVDQSGVAPPGAPSYLVHLAPGTYSSEGVYWTPWKDEGFDGPDSFHALVVRLGEGRLITTIDIEKLEEQQNQDALLSAIWAAFLVGLIGGVIVWLHGNLVRPVRDLAERMQAIDPSDVDARLPTTYKREEIQIIAQASNAHLERVAQFIERERSLMGQASHEFRTPIAVIAGAVDLLKQAQLPQDARPALARIEQAVEGLSETMVALLYLAREAPREQIPEDVTVLHDLLPRLVADHHHLLLGKTAQLRTGAMEPTFVAVPEAMARIAVSNLLRNAIEHTEAGYVEISLADGVIVVTDSGSGFDPVEAARRYRESLQQSAPSRGQGLGLFLIGRICDRFGWRLEISPAGTAGTRARLDVSRSVIAVDAI